MKVRALVASSAVLLACTALASAQDVNAGTDSSTLTLSQKTEGPGISLSPGTYSVRIENQLKDRIVVAVQKNGSRNAASLLAYPDRSISTGNGAGPIIFNSGLKGKPTLRGFAFPSGTVAEFIYPKKDAVALATSNDVRVMAVDPASQGMTSLPHLAPSDMSEVTLWMLTPTPVEPGSSKPGIQAARYQAPAAPAQQTTEAQNTVSPARSSSYASAPAQQATTQPAYNTSPALSQSTTPSSYQSSGSNAPAAPVQVASNNHAPRIRTRVRELPHTASNLPLLLLAACLSIGLGILLRVWNVRLATRQV